MRVFTPLALAALLIAGGGSALALALAEPMSPRNVLSGRTVPQTILSGHTVHSACLDVDVPVETELSLLGAYEGGVRDRPRQFREHTPGTIRVTATGNGPVVLILSAYEPVRWDLGDVAPGRLRGVIAYGYHPPTVIGAGENVPVRIVAREADNPAQCGSPAWVHRGGQSLDRLAAQAEAATGLKLVRFSGAYKPRQLDLDQPSTDRLGWLRRGGRQVMVQPDILPGSERLAGLLAAGAVRPATTTDIDAWNAAATARLATGRLTPYQSPMLHLGSTYVVLRPLTIPDGMHGAHSRTFIIPAGVARPTDRDSHNNYYTMADGGCDGALCSDGD